MSEVKEKAEKIIKQYEEQNLGKRIRELEVESAKPNLWDNWEHAQGVMKEMSDLKKEQDEMEMLQLLIDEGEEKELEEEVNRLEKKLYLSGPYDNGNAILSIHSGQGGTEAMDWASMLKRMYLRYFERMNWKFEVVDETPGEEAGIKSCEIIVNGKPAYGFLKNEIGVHRLVRLSPFNSDNLRQTSFAHVEVLPEIESDMEIDIKEDELEMDMYRSSGPGGQNVNKVSTAIRITHLPTGIIVSSQKERSQLKNREHAMKILRGKLFAIRQQEVRDKEKSLKGDYKIPGWGNQIRSYVLHPYKMVKDVRTKHESKNPDAVLDGDIQDFIEANLTQSNHS